MDNILVIEDLIKVFRSKSGEETIALKGVSYSFEKGKIYAVYGPSGSGKTTLLECIGNILRPTAGKIFFDNKDIGDFRDEQSSQYRIHDIGFVFQEANLLPSMTIYENIEFPLILSKTKSKSERREIIDNILEEMDIVKTKNSFSDEVSAGEKQRAAIAMAMMNEPLLILADEPTANLDAENRTIILNLLREIVKKGKIVIVATHDTNVMDAADIKLHLDKGVLVN